MNVAHRKNYLKHWYRINRKKKLEQSRRNYRKNRRNILKRMKKYYAANREEFKKRNRDTWFRKPAKERRILSRRKAVKCMYNLSPEKHDELLKKQNYKCPISGLRVDLFSDIDHDHRCCHGDKSCGKCIRGILVRSVNSALGAFRNPKWLLKAYEYVTK